MGKYRIKYNYDTGDSFRNEYGLEEYLELEFDSIEVAEKNLQRIKEHYQLYEACENRWNRKKTNQELISEYQDKDWLVKKMITVAFYDVDKKKYQSVSEKDIERHQKVGREVGEVFDEYYASHCIILMSDTGQPFQIRCPWCGYFERLNFVEIEENNPNRRISFRDN